MQIILYRIMAIKCLLYLPSLPTLMLLYGFKPVKKWTPLLNMFRRRGILELMYKVQMQFFEDEKLMRGGPYMNLMSSLKPPYSNDSIKEQTQRTC
ncbi:hypothetical protein N665_1990s0002 [Sinapis alba]|nr:hypothetical protein N665_1990s0002 [Sinapis alba]